MRIFMRCRRRKQRKEKYIDPENRSYSKGLVLGDSVSITIPDEAIEKFFSEIKWQNKKTKVNGS